MIHVEKTKEEIVKFYEENEELYKEYKRNYKKYVASYNPKEMKYPKEHFRLGALVSLFFMLGPAGLFTTGYGIAYLLTCWLLAGILYCIGCYIQYKDETTFSEAFWKKEFVKRYYAIKINPTIDESFDDIKAWADKVTRWHGGTPPLYDKFKEFMDEMGIEIDE